MSAAITTEFNDNGVATVTLTRPEKHNAFDDHIITQLAEAFVAVDQNPDAKLMILAAQGKSFSAGADLSWMKRMANFSYEENLDDAQSLATMLKTLDRLSKPTIARVQGAAFGGAVGLISCCDMAVGTPEANFRLSEVKIGLVPATISPYIVAAIGQRAARRYCLTAESISAETAQHLGLLSAIVESDCLDDEIERLSKMLLSNSNDAIRATKSLIFDVATQPVSEQIIAQTSQVIATARVSEDAQQRLARFLNRDKG